MLFSLRFNRRRTTYIRSRYFHDFFLLTCCNVSKIRKLFIKLLKFKGEVKGAFQKACSLYIHSILIFVTSIPVGEWNYARFYRFVSRWHYINDSIIYFFYIGGFRMYVHATRLVPRSTRYFRIPQQRRGRLKRSLRHQGKRSSNDLILHFFVLT